MTYLKLQKFSFILLISSIYFIVYYLYSGTPLMGIWESLNYYNIFSPNQKYFNLEYSPRSNLGDVGHGLIEICRYIIEFLNLDLNISNFRIPSLIYGYLTVIFFFIICNRYFSIYASLVTSILLVINPLFNHFISSMTILMPSFFAFIFLIERLQSIKIHGINKTSYLLIIPFYILFMHYGATKIIGLALLLFFLIQKFFIYNSHNKIYIYYNFLKFLLITFLITIILLSISSFKNLLVIFHPLNLFFGTGELALLESSDNSTTFIDNLKVNLIIIFESFINFNLFNFVSNNVNYVSADFRFEFINKILFIILIFGIILLIIKFLKTKKKFLSIYFDIIFIFLICVIPQFISIVYEYDNLDKPLIATLSTQRLFIIVLPIYLIICLFFDEIFSSTKRIVLKILLILFLIIYNIVYLNSNYSKFINSINDIPLNISINQSNINWSKEIIGAKDRRHFQHLQLHNKYYHISKKICNDYSSHTMNNIYKIDLNHFNNNFNFPEALPYLTGFNFHVVFLSLYLSTCGISNSWFQIIDNKYSKRKVGFTEFRNYSAKLINNDKIEYQGIQLMHNLRNYNKGVNFNILVTNEYEFNLAKKYFINKKLKFKYFDY